MATQFSPNRSACLLALYVTTNACTVPSGSLNPPTVMPASCVANNSWGCQSMAQPVATSAVTSPAPPTTPLPAVAPTAATLPTATLPTATLPAAAPPPTAVPLSSNTLAAQDALGRGDTAFLRQRVQVVVGEIIVALEPTLRTRVERIPIVFDPSRTEVNAFATCSRANKSAVVITDGMLVLTLNLAQLKAVDEVFGTSRFDEYARYVAQNQKANEPLLSPPANWLTLEQKSNRTAMTRQLQLFDEMIAFVFGHELAHHYLNHLPCTSILPLDASEVGILVTDAIPAFNQPNEAAADVAAIRNLLKTSTVQLGHALTEGGALAQLRFFGALDNSRPVDVFTFERTHPPPSVREPIVKTAAQAFRMGAQITWPWSS